MDCLNCKTDITKLENDKSTITLTLIKLLEESKCLDYKICRYPITDCIWCGKYKPQLIALIKEEEND